jgi:hypothetical protein
MTHDILKGAIALGIIIGKKESTERLESLANEIATAGVLTDDSEANLKLLGHGVETIELIITAVKEAVFDRASDGHYQNMAKLSQMVKTLSGKL